MGRSVSSARPRRREDMSDDDTVADGELFVLLKKARKLRCDLIALGVAIMEPVRFVAAMALVAREWRTV